MDRINVIFEYLPVLNFAVQQNRIPVIRSLVLENITDTDLSGVEVRISGEPDFAPVQSAYIDLLPAHAKIQIDALSINLSANYMAQLTERLFGNLALMVSSGEEILFKQDYPVDVLAYDQWSGLTVFPEVLSAFVTPNHAALASVLKRAAAILEQWTGSASLDEYQSRNPDRVRKQMAAVYTAIAESGVIYSTVPASFEEYGQRVRMVDTVLSQKLGTCLDMALLYASCLEAIGIHPLIVIVQGHAFAGGWLVPETFPDNVTDDVSFLNLRTAEGIHDIVLVETTGMNYGNGSDFDAAVKIAQDRLTRAADFILALDVKRSRLSGIRPIPQRILKAGQWEIEEEEIAFSDLSQAAPQSINRYDLSGFVNETELTKQLVWERKLLDLSLRNNLLNIRITKNTLQLLSADIGGFEDALAEGDEFVVVHKPEEWEAPASEFGVYKPVPASDPVMELIRADLEQKRLRSFFPDNDLQGSLTHLYRSSRTAMEENGANTLYIALGLLKWYETPTSERPRFAPVLLLPVEIVRKSAAKGYVVRSREEEPMINVTLLEMLRQNFKIDIPGLEPLPSDEKGIDVKLILSIVRHAIKGQKRWDVEEQAILGLFSFNKFIMWNDIHHNAQKLSANPIVSSLINGRIEWEAEEITTDASELDKELSPADILLPISADSSQLEAIYEAVNDRSFVLHGPPGTGKSQTITNIIANALYRGKRVLFVAEKMAALSVVQKRLAALGLAPFCLELHSNKIKKTAVLSQLRETCEVVRRGSPESFAQEAERLHGMRVELNVYVDALHRKYPFGLSAYEAITRYQSIAGDDEFSIPTALLDNLHEEKAAEWREAVEALVSTMNACGSLYQHPLEGISIREYSSEIKADISKIIAETDTALGGFRAKLPDLQLFFGGAVADFDRKQTDVLMTVVGILTQIPELTAELLRQTRLGEKLDEWQELVPHGRERDALKTDIIQFYTEGVLSIDASKALAEWNTANGKWFVPRWLGQRRIAKSLKAYSLLPDSQSADVRLQQIVDYQREKGIIDPYSDVLFRLFGKYGRAGGEDWTVVEEIIDNVRTIDRALLTVTGDIEAAGKIKESLAGKMAEGMGVFRTLYATSLNESLRLYHALTLAETELSLKTGSDTDTLYGDSAEWPETAHQILQRWQSNLNQLKDWYQLLQTCERLDRLGIGFITERLKTEAIPADRVVELFDKGFYAACVKYILSREPALELFKGKLFEEVIRKYRELFDRFMTLTRQELHAKLAANIPSFTREATQNSEVGILQRNIRNNARGTSIRKLFDQIPTLLPRMCPCMLMSPISVAQYIDIDAEKFDLVVFDEASQMPAYEAVGALARGKNMVIVGDPKQMPPTSFFTVNTTDEENIEMEDLESILDDCLALSMPSKHLLWHYRSKHESLIAFSNAEYYDNKLLTFPSPDNIESKVRLVPVEGVYDKGRTRQNKAEATAVVDEICRRLEDVELRKRSIGVVTFSSVQQNLIDDMLYDRFARQPELEQWAMECEEPLFIKNLENVQGDERDVILFSVGYGPDANGRVSMNFGPLNREGGERRLNVAVSRARYEMIIYSTLRADQIDLKRTSSVGVAGLKGFLEFAEKGSVAVPQRSADVASTDALEEIIAQRLRDTGYTVHTRVGCSGYRIDIGIVDPRDPSRYCLGILCDGRNYKQTKTMRDREIVQTQVLKLLGWNIHRIWTMDWYENPDVVLDSITAVIEEGRTMLEEELLVQAPVLVEEINAPENSPKQTTSDNPAQEYKQVTLRRGNYPSEQFSEYYYRETIMRQAQEVLWIEAPVSRSLLCKRVLDAWGISRLGTRINACFDEVFAVLPCFRTERDGLTTFWNNEEQYKNYAIYRTGSGRDAADLPPEEVAVAMRYILSHEVGLPLADLYRQAAQLLGFSRMGTNVDAAMRRGLAAAVERGYLKTDNGRAVIG